MRVTHSYQQTFERTVERISHAARSLRLHDERLERRRLVGKIPRKPVLDNVMDKRRGYGILSGGMIDGVSEAVAFAQQARNHHAEPTKKKRDYNPTILEAKRYEDAPAFFDLALSDNVLQIACDYLGEIPVLMGIKLWCTPPNEHLKGSQVYHRDGQKWLLRRAKFLINMDDVDADCGPFTFLPADVSERVSAALGSMKNQGRVTDETIYRVAKPSDAVSLIGSAGTGAVVDSSRCFHYGARVRAGERLLLQFHFLHRADALHGGPCLLSKHFVERFGDDPIRALVVPNWE
jgi:hypothetical protein